MKRPDTVSPYSSVGIQIFLKIAECIENEARAQIVQDRVLAPHYRRGSMQHHLTSDGTSVARGRLSTTAGDFARIGLLFAPSCGNAAVRPVVSSEVRTRLQTAGRQQTRHRRDGAFALRRFLDLIMKDGKIGKHAL